MLKDTTGKIYRVGECLGTGGHGSVCAGISPTGQEVAIKRETIQPNQAITLDSERRVYDQLGTFPGIPKFYGWGKSENEQYLFLERLGDSMAKIISVRKTLTDEEIRFIAFQLLRILQHIHSRGFSYGDFNNGNILWNQGDKKQIYLSDFGVTSKFKFSSGHVKYQPRRVKSPEGTALFASLDAHHGAEISRRGDLESLGYLLSSWELGNLPWSGQKIPKMIEMKEQFMGSGPRLKKYFEIVKNLEYDEEPDYSKLIDIFLTNE